jgi:SAM-dependent methyltransferase
MLDRATVSLLRCPTCRAGSLDSRCVEEGGRLVSGVLVCASCRAEFRVDAGIPYLRASGQENEEIWNTWRHHIEGFAARRASRDPAVRAQGSPRWQRKMEAFGRFLDVPDGRVLDVGCGPGNIRRSFDPKRVAYYGADPLPVEEVGEFPFVCALAESIPFRSGTFSSMIVRSALDHFRDLDGFFKEATRVLTSDGRFFLEQVIHDNTSVGDLVRNTAHFVKDVVDDLKTFRERRSAPKHMHEFTPTSLRSAVEPFFEVERIQTYNTDWFSPTQLFLALRCRANART